MDYCQEKKKLFLLSPTAVLQAMELTDIKINDSEAYDILYSAVHHYATSVLLDDIEEQFRKAKSSLKNDLKSEKDEKENIIDKFSRLYNKDFQDYEMPFLKFV